MLLSEYRLGRSVFLESTDENIDYYYFCWSRLGHHLLQNIIPAVSCIFAKHTELFASRRRILERCAFVTKSSRLWPGFGDGGDGGSAATML